MSSSCVKRPIHSILTNTIHSNTTSGLTQSKVPTLTHTRNIMKCKLPSSTLFTHKGKTNQSQKNSKPFQHFLQPFYNAFKKKFMKIGIVQCPPVNLLLKYGLNASKQNRFSRGETAESSILK